MRSLVILVAVGCSGSPKPVAPPPPPPPSAPAPQPPPQAPRPVEVDATTGEHEDETALSAKRWVYASFFNRFKRRVAAQWDPQKAWRSLGPPPPSGTKTTTVSVELAPGTGAVVSVLVVAGSGTTALDDEALRAIRAGAPYGDPPPGLDKDGVVAFQFAFYFETGSQQGSMRAARPQP